MTTLEATTKPVRSPLLAAAALRGLLAIVAIPLAPVLYHDHFALLVLLRPTKEVLLAAGFLIRNGDANVFVIVLAAIPLLVAGVWLFFFLGRSFADDLEGEGLPGLAGRVLPARRVQQLKKILDRRGPKLIFLGRLAAFPSTFVASAAGSSDLPRGRFLVADGAGAACSLAAALGAGYGLGSAYEQAGPWLTALGVAVVVALVVLFGRYLRRIPPSEGGSGSDRDGT